MELIDNLELLHVGDFISRSTGALRNDLVIYKVVGVNDKVIQIEVRRKAVLEWSVVPTHYEDSYKSGETDIIFKNLRKIKKKKLKHKIVTYNDKWIIFKLNNKEKQDIIRKGILENLDYEENR